MALQGISTGTTPNDGTGDSLLVGAVKVNDNFQEIYNALGNGTNLLTGNPGLTVGFITATGASFTGDVSIGGTLTYEDVTNIDSVGLITARDGISVLGAGITVTGISTFYSSTTIGAASTFTDSGLSVGSAVTVTATGVNVTGVVTATTFEGSGASLTNIPNGALTNSSISIGGLTFNLGDTDASPNFNLVDANSYPYSSLTGITTNILGDTSPQLGGDLDLNGSDITGTGDINITGSCTLTNGDVVLSNGRGIDFSATADSTGTVTSELFDNYEEGSFTPTAAAGYTSPTYSSQEGYYTRVGNLLYVTGTFVLSGGTATGSGVQIGGMPFTSANPIGTGHAMVSVNGATSTASNQFIFGTMSSNTTTIDLYHQTTTATQTVAGTDLGNAVTIRFSATYRVQ
jgi:hypothetical protein